MKAIFILFLFITALPLFAWDTNLVATSAGQFISATSNDLPDVVPYTPPDSGIMAGRYYNYGGLSQDRLYLFSDYTYIFTHEADLYPETIQEMGKWTLSDGAIINTPDDSLPKALIPQDHTYFLFSPRSDTNPSLPTNVYLLGANWNFSYLVAHIESIPYYMFRMCSLEKIEQYDGSSDQTIKEDLMKKAWRPEHAMEDK